MKQETKLILVSSSQRFMAALIVGSSKSGAEKKKTLEAAEFGQQKKLSG